MDGSRCSKCSSFSNSPTTAAFDISVAAGTRHYAFLHTNEPPEDFETAFIHSVIAKIDARLQCVDDEISKLQEKLDQLEEERASLSRYRTRNKASLSPLRRFPPEVLGEIFSWTLPSLDEEWDRRRFSIDDSPWVLTHISSHWRTIALSTPSLWSRIVLYYASEIPNLSSAYPLSLAEAQIQRAQKLRIHFHGSEKVDFRLQSQMFQLLMRHSLRWEELNVGVTSEMLSLLPALRDRIPSLRRLWIEWNDLETQAAEAIHGFQTAPSLVEVGIFNHYRFEPLANPTHQLTRFQLVAYPTNQLLCYQLDCSWEIHKGILKLAPNLVEARIMFRIDDERWPDADEIIDLPYLRRLYVSYTEALAYLRAPALEGLALWVEKGVDTVLPHLESFSDRSACSLRRLSRALTQLTKFWKSFRLSPS